MLGFNILARKYTDEVYLSKSELVNKVSSGELETLWKSIVEYREKYRFSISLRRVDSLPFTICLTPALLSYSAECERRMLEFTLRYERLKTLESFSEDKVLTKFKQTAEINDLLAIAKRYNLNFNSKDIELIINSRMSTSNLIYGVHNSIENLCDSRKDIQVAEMLKVNNVLTKNTGFRINEISYYPSCSKIEENMYKLVDFVDNTTTLSCFVVAACIFGYYLYCSPFDKRSDLTGLLIALKHLRNCGYGESVYFTSIIKRVFQTNRFGQALESTKLYGDLTYLFVAFCEEFLDAVDEQYDQIMSVYEPEPKEKQIKYIEKIVEVPVEKIVYQDREVIKEVEKVVEKEVPVENPYDYLNDPFRSSKLVEKSNFGDEYIDMMPIVKAHIKEEPADLANAMLVANPLMKFNQAHFYSRHHEEGKYYTISQFKEFAGCVYETARTSMEYLVEVNLYRKEQLKNKFVYIPKKVED